MKSVRTLLFQATVVLALAFALHQPLRADSPAPIQADSPYASTTVTSDSSDNITSDSSLLTPAVATLPVSAPEDLADVPPSAATHTFSLPNLSVTALADDFEVGLMNSLPLAALITLLTGFHRLFFGKGKPRKVIEKDQPVVIPPRRIPQPTPIY